MFITLVVFLQIVTGIVAAEGAVRKYPEGAIALDTAASLGLRVLLKAADPRFRTILRSLRTTSTVASLAFAGVAWMIPNPSATDNLGWLSIFCACVAVSLHLHIDLKRTLVDYVSIAIHFVAIPWLLLLVDALTFFQNDLLMKTSAFFGLGGLRLYEQTALLSTFGLGVGLLIALSSFLLLSWIPALTLLLVSIVTIAAKACLRVPRKIGYYFAVLYALVLGPILLYWRGEGLL